MQKQVIKINVHVCTFIIHCTIMYCNSNSVSGCKDALNDYYYIGSGSVAESLVVITVSIR